jgi:hypothetical protein
MKNSISIRLSVLFLCPLMQLASFSLFAKSESKEVREWWEVSYGLGLPPGARIDRVFGSVNFLAHFWSGGAHAVADSSFDCSSVSMFR